MSLSNSFKKHLNTNVVEIEGFIAIDGYGNVLPTYPTGFGVQPVQQTYTFCKGLTDAIGPGPNVKLQPHIATGVYQFTLDRTMFATALVGISVTLQDGYVAGDGYHLLTAYATANVLGELADPVRSPYNAGTDQTQPVKTVTVSFRNNTTGVLTDPITGSGFWLRIVLRQSDNL